MKKHKYSDYENYILLCENSKGFRLNYSHFLRRNALPFYGEKGLTRQHEIEGEVPFTNLIKKKLELKLYCPKIENMILSWKQTKKRGIEFPARVVTHDERFKI